MLFNSPKFILFLTVLFIFYYLSPLKQRNIVLLISSYIFYSFWDIRFVIFLVGMTLVTYLFGWLIASIERNRFYILILGLILVFTNLIFLKYVSLLISTFYTLSFLTEYKWILPIGISFYTFQSASYLIDVYRDKL